MELTSDSPAGEPEASALVALAVPGVRVARDRCRRPHAPVIHAVGVDVNVLPRAAVRAVVVDALPAVSGAALQLGLPPSRAV